MDRQATNQAMDRQATNQDYKLCAKLLECDDFTILTKVVMEAVTEYKLRKEAEDKKEKPKKTKKTKKTNPAFSPVCHPSNEDAC